jgi:hypothetical protein
MSQAPPSELLNRDQWARGVLERAWPEGPTLQALQIVQAVGRFEGGYGHANDPAWAGSNNWGAIQCGHGPPCGVDCFEHADTHADGTPYTTCFRRYPSAIDGARGLVHELLRRPAVAGVIDSGNATAVANAMHASKYFEATASSYAKNLFRNAQAIALALGEPLAVALDAPVLTLPGRGTSSASSSASPITAAGILWGLYELAKHSRKGKYA